MTKKTKTDATPRPGNLVRVETPAFLSLVGLPANQTGFKVVRSDTTKGETQMSKSTKAPIARRVARRSETNPIMALAFPSEYTPEAVAETLKQFGMTGYTVETVEGVVTARRADLQSIAKEGTTTVKLTSDGVVATIARSDVGAEQHQSIALASIEFDPNVHTEDTISAWLQRNSVDIPIPAIENPDAVVVVKRSDVSEQQEVRRVDLGDGVVAVIVQAEIFDAPDPLAQVLADSAYGNYGWGFMDFSMSMADAEFSAAMDDANWRLRQVLDRIMLYSGLPLDTRKLLVQNALAQYGEFINGWIDSLPRQVMASVIRSDTKESTTMSKENQTQAAPAADEKVTLTRAELAELVKESVAKELEVQRAAAPAATDPAAATQTAAPAQAAAPAATETAVVTRADMVEAMKEVVAPLVERVAGLEGKTVLRSEGDDPATKKAVKRTDHLNADGSVNMAKVFRGAISGLPGRRHAEDDEDEQQ